MGKSGFDMDAASCQGCAYAAIAKVGLHGSHLLECRRNPPVIALHRDGGHLQLGRGYWPTVSAEDWCGDHEDATAGADTVEAAPVISVPGPWQDVPPAAPAAPEPKPKPKGFRIGARDGMADKHVPNGGLPNGGVPA